MDDKLQEALGELLNKANNGIDTAGAFLSEEIPEVVSQLLLWHGVYNLIQFIVGVILLTIGITLSSKIAFNIPTKGHWSHNHCDNDISATGFISLLGALFSLIGGLIYINFIWLQIYLAPKVWLLEYAASLAK